MSTPAIGEIVHYVSYGTPQGEFASQCRAAVVTHVTDRNAKGEHAPGAPVIGVCVLNPTGIFFNDVPYALPDPPQGGTWHWAEGRT